MLNPPWYPLNYMAYLQGFCTNALWEKAIIGSRGQANKKIIVFCLLLPLCNGSAPITRPQQHGTNDATPTTRQQWVNNNNSTPTTQPQQLNTNNSAPTNQHQRLNTNNSTPTTQHQRLNTNDSTPTTNHKQRNTNNSTPMTQRQQLNAKSSTPMTQHQRLNTKDSTPKGLQGVLHVYYRVVHWIILFFLDWYLKGSFCWGLREKQYEILPGYEILQRNVVYFGLSWYNISKPHLCWHVWLTLQN